MSTTIAVALITTLSTLAGVAITGTISLLVGRAQIKGQLILADISSREKLASNKRQIRRDVYVGFLNQADLIERRLQFFWYVNPGIDSDPLITLTDEMNELSAKHNLIALEGPAEVAHAASEYWNQLFEELKTIKRLVLESDGTTSIAPGNIQLYDDALDLRQQTKNTVTLAAQKALEDTALPQSFN